VQIFLRRVDPKRLVEWKKAEPSSVIAARVLAAREIQRKRFEGEGIFCNAAMSNKHIEKYCPLSAESKQLLERIIDNMGLSARACTRIIKLARTIADMAASPDILPEHISEASAYRFLDKQNIFE
jgi:magnesium chelatase family protein